MTSLQNPFVGHGDRPAPKPDIKCLSAPEGFLVSAANYYQSQQEMRDGFLYFVQYCREPNEPVQKVYDDCYQEAVRPFVVTDNTVSDKMYRKPAVVVGSMGAVSYNMFKHRHPNSRLWTIGVLVNREQPATRLMNQFEKELVDQIRSIFRQMAHVDSPGALAFTVEEARRASFRERSEEELGAMVRESKIAERKSVAESRKHQTPSDRLLRARLLGLACYRYIQAGYSVDEYICDAAIAGLEMRPRRLDVIRRYQATLERQKLFWSVEYPNWSANRLIDLPKPLAKSGRLPSPVQFYWPGRLRSERSPTELAQCPFEPR